ncbi:MAG: hypothetical protein EOP06_19590, partial [Proteobacteria bacterium]
MTTANGTPTVETGVNYGCLVSAIYNPKWFTLYFPSNGNFTMTGTQTAAGGNPLDLDYVLYGPFDSSTCGSALTASTVASCDYGASNTITIDLEVEANQYYMLLFTNFSSDPGYVVLTRETSAGSAILECGETEFCNVDLTVQNACEYQGGGSVWATSSNENASFSWTLNGVPLATTSAYLSGYGPGTYTVTASDGLCSISETVVLTTEDFAQNTVSGIVECNGGTVDLTSKDVEIVNGADVINFSIMYHNSFNDALDIANPITNPEAYVATDIETIYYSVENLISGTGCIEVGSFMVSLSSPSVWGVTVDAQTATVNANGGNLLYAVDSGEFVAQNVFIGLSLGPHTVVVQNDCGIDQVTFVITVPSPPTGETMQAFAPGATLGDIIVNGENIQWYSYLYGDGLTPTASLPLSTELVDGMTYYASQTINGLESEGRFPVTVSLTLAVGESAFSRLTFRPNPVSSLL